MSAYKIADGLLSRGLLRMPCGALPEHRKHESLIKHL